MSGLLSSFAISVAANIVTSLFSKNNTEKEIRTAFQDAIEKWCPNEDIRRFREREISKLLEDYMANPNMDPSNLPADMKEFLSVFEQCVAEHPAAFNYLSAIKEKGYYDVVMTSIQGVHHKLDVIQEKLDAANPIHEELHSEAVAEYNMRHWMNKHALSSFVSWLLTLVRRLENVLFENENQYAWKDSTLAMVAK